MIIYSLVLLAVPLLALVYSRILPLLGGNFAANIKHGEHHPDSTEHNGKNNLPEFPIFKHDFLPHFLKFY